ncbi:MAG TPA: GTP cyclohydrolase I FolE [Alphaproteobacteria bacterium]|nr:GTP cyclohydrolase I FolE [Alphaproteobacteria bacterium]
MAPFDLITEERAQDFDAAGERRAVTRRDAEEAIRTLLIWAGDNPEREGLVDTPARVARAYEEFFSGYDADPAEMLSQTFEEVEGYDDIVLLRDIAFQSHCEHHVVPIIGTAHIAYLPDRRVVGISKLARVLDSYARRLQTQETMTAQIGGCIDAALKPWGVMVIVKAQHQCMTTRGVNKPGVAMVTRHLSGVFRDDPLMERRVMDLLSA